MAPIHTSLSQHIGVDEDQIPRSRFGYEVKSATVDRGHQILSFGYGSNTSIESVELEYADPITDAPILAEYNAIPNAIADRTGIQSLAKLSDALAQTAVGAGLRQAYWTFSTMLDKDLATATKDAFFAELPAVYDVEGLLPAVSLQFITEPILGKTTKNSRNALGLDPNEGPIMNGPVALKWKNKAGDDRVNTFAKKVVDRAVAAAKAKGKYEKYLYMNARPWQDPVASYGAEKKARLQDISRKYDPTGMFERLQPGYFKLDAAPRSN